MHVLHVIDSLALGGAERMLVEIANQATDDGHQVSVCITRQGCALANALRSEIEVFVLNRSKRFDLAAMNRFAILLKNQHVDIIHAHGRSTLAFMALLTTFHIIRLPIIFHDHYGQIEIDNTIPPWFRYWARRYVAQYVGVAPKLAKWAQDSGLAPKRINVIQNALDLSRIQMATPTDLRGEFAIPSDTLLGIIVGNIRYEKGIDILLSAVAQSVRACASRILIVGGDADREYAEACRAQSDALGLSERVLFVGQRLDIPSLLKSADFALISSRSESGPLVLLEYMAAGLPFIATRVGGISEQVANLAVTEFVPPNYVGTFAKALDHLLNLSTEERRHRGVIGQEVVLRRFDIRYAMADWYKVYSAAIDSDLSHSHPIIPEMQNEQ